MPIIKLAVFGKSEQISTTGTNLLNYSRYKVNVEKNVEVKYDSYNITIKNDNNYVIMVDLPMKLGAGNYYLSSEKQISTPVYKENKWYSNGILNSTKGKFNVTEPGEYCARITVGENSSIDIKKLMCSKTEEAVYEPYTGSKPSPSVEYPQEITSCGENGIIDLKITGNNAEPQTLVLQTPNGLPGLKVNSGGNYTEETGQQWICDEIDLARGKYVQRIGKQIFDGTEQLIDNLGTRTSFWLRVDDIRPETGLCNYGKIVKVNTIEQEELSFSISGTGIYLYTTKTADEFKNELKQKYDSGKPVEVLYALKTPVEIDLPAETIATFKKLHTNYPTTIVSNNADAGMELTYTVDTQSYIDGKIAEVSTAIVQKGI